VRTLRPAVDVRVGLLDHGPPHVVDVEGAIAVPLLLSAGYHVRIDLPEQAPSALVAGAVGPDPRLSVALADRLAEAGYDGCAAITLAAAGSADERSRADVVAQARLLAAHLGVEVTVAYVAAGEPRLADVRPAVVASYLLARGTFHDAIKASSAEVVSEPIGDHPVLAELVLSRYEGAKRTQTQTQTQTR
jgi:uroporphyrin-III C-methyltransferase / precorrin-2 dehydrogenase / sirohydrochlorin ferrochelatase